MPDIIFIFPKFRKPVYAEPVGICFLTAYLRERGFSAAIDESFLYGFTPGEVAEKVAGQQPSFVGISVNSRPEFHDALEFSDRLRAAGYSGNIIIGGHAISLNAETFLKKGKYIDAIVIGEGEMIIGDMLTAYRQGRDWRQVNGLKYLDERGEVQSTGNGRVIEDVDRIPFMDRNILARLIDLHDGISPVNATILNNRGCYGTCNFCSIRQISEAQGARCFRERSMRNLVKEIKVLVDRFGIRDFYFCSPTFLASRAKGEKQSADFLGYIKEYDLDITFFVYLRTDGISQGIIRNLKRAGLRTLFLGIESFDDQVLEGMQKNISARQNLEVLDILCQEGFGCGYDADFRLKVGYITFTPETTLESLRRQIKYIRQYRIPAKKLTYIYETHNEKDVDGKREGVSNIEKAPLADPCVNDVYQCFTRFFSYAVSPLERVRSAQKSRADIDPELNDRYHEFLGALNDVSYDCFEALVNSDSKEERTNICRDHIRRLGGLIEGNRLLLDGLEEQGPAKPMFEYRLERAVNNPQLS